MQCDPHCIACMRYDYDFFSVPAKHQSGGTPECLADIDEPEHDGHKCICPATSRGET